MPKPPDDFPRPFSVLEAEPSLQYCLWCRNGYQGVVTKNPSTLFCGKCREEREANLQANGWTRGVVVPDGEL